MPLRRLLILGTGGTIAGVGTAPGSTVGYRAGALPIDQLLTTVPALGTLGEVHAEQVFSIASEEMTAEHWLQLAQRLRAMPRDPVQADAVVVAHGTDTLEETAFFLSLMLPASLPVILTGAMRPSTALDADGPGNLYKAGRFALAAHERGIGGTFVAFGDRVFRPDAVVKRHTSEVLAFEARYGQPVAWMESGQPVWSTPEAGLQAALAQRDLPAPPACPIGTGPVSAQARCSENAAPAGKAGVAGGSATAQAQGAGNTAPNHLAGGASAPGTSAVPLLPPVALIHQHVDADPAQVAWLLSRGCRGIVLAGTGIGTMPGPMRAALAAARLEGCLIVRASRVATGFVGRNTEPDPANSDEALGFITAGWLDPLKARILLQLCLAAGNTDSNAIQALFDRCHP